MKEVAEIIHHNLRLCRISGIVDLPGRVYFANATTTVSALK